MASLPTEKAPHLLAPLTLANGQEVQTRVALAPLTRGRSGPTRVPNDIMVEYYAARAENTGIVITEATTIDDEHSNGWKDSAGIYTADQAAGWKKVVDAVHAKGAKIVVQLWHMGRAAHDSYLEGRQVVSASAEVINGANFGSDGVHAADESKQPYQTPRALTVDEIAHIVDNYRKATELAVEAGFDGVEIHSANGYLLNQFLDPNSNKRTDNYGGSVENRSRFLNEVLDAVSTVLPANRIAVRLSPNGVYNDMGHAESIETYTYLFSELSKRGLMYLHVMDGLTFGFHKKSEVFTIANVRKVYGAGVIMCNVGYDRDTGDKVIADGHADLVAYGRPFIGNPDLVYRYAHDVPLSESNPATWFTHDNEGYNTYPTYLEAQAANENQTATAADTESKAE